MAEEYVSKAHFDEYAKRMDERFDHVIERADERFYSLEKRMEESFAHVNQRFDDMNRSVNQRFDSLEKRFDDLRTMLVIMYTPIALAVLGAAIKVLFFSK